MIDPTLAARMQRLILKAIQPVMPVGLALTAVALISPGHAAEPPLPSTFVEWCNQQHEFDFLTSDTIDALLAEVGTTDCQEAALRLQSVDALTLNSLGQVPADEMPLIISCLQISLPTGVDLRPVVAAMPNLRILDLSHTWVPDLTPLQQLAGLEDLTLAHTGLTDLTPLAGLSNLVQLDISANQVQDLSPLAGLDRLQRLDVSDNAISDLRVLAELPSLQRLSLANNPIDPDTCGSTWADACDSHSYLDP